MLSQLLFSAITLAAVALFSINLRKIIRNIRLGKKAERSDKPWQREYISTDTPKIPPFVIFR